MSAAPNKPAPTGEDIDAEDLRVQLLSNSSYEAFIKKEPLILYNAHNMMPLVWQEAYHTGYRQALLEMQAQAAA